MPHIADQHALRLTVGPYTFRARLELELAPRTCAAVRALLPLRTRIIHARWSGEALWIPGGDDHVDLAYENNTTYPQAGEILFYPGGRSERELLLPYGPTRFASRAGDLSGNHFATIVEGRERLPDLGRLVLWEGAQPVLIEEAD